MRTKISVFKMSKFQMVNDVINHRKKENTSTTTHSIILLFL